MPEQVKHVEQVPVWRFWQNNSGGSFADGMPHVAMIEARTWQEANEIALRMGIYFDGIDAGRDCECCGDRWSALGEHSEPQELAPNDGAWHLPYGATEWVHLDEEMGAEMR